MLVASSRHVSENPVTITAIYCLRPDTTRRNVLDRMMRAPEFALRVKTATAMRSVRLCRILARGESRQGMPRLIDIAQAVCAAYGVTLAEMRSLRRHKRLATARLCFYHHATNLTARSRPEIGRFINKDPSTVLKGARAFAKKDDGRFTPRQHWRPLK